LPSATSNKVNPHNHPTMMCGGSNRYDWHPQTPKPQLKSMFSEDVFDGNTTSPRNHKSFLELDVHHVVNRRIRSMAIT